MNPPEPVNIGVSRQIGHDAGAIRVPGGYEQIITSGRPGLTAERELPGNVTEQARQLWQNAGVPSTTGQDPEAPPRTEGGERDLPRRRSLRGSTP
jgi:hypothetical protein